MSFSTDQIRLLSKLGANVRRLRTKAKMTQERLAELAEINPRTVQKIEAGKLDILVTTASRLQAALKCDWNELMD